MKFEELELPDEVRAGIRDAGFTECTPVQALSLPVMLQGRDVAAQAQTGTGKTAAFLIGIFSRMLTAPSPRTGSSPRALIVAPTRELVVQIDAEAKLIGSPAGFTVLPVYGGIDYEKQRRELGAGVDVLVGTPGRLIDYLKQNVYSLKGTRFLVIDEADRMFDMGFISDLRFLLRKMAPYNQRQSMLFSATLTHRVMELCYEHMNNPELIKVTPGQITVELIHQEIYHVSKSEKSGLLLGLLRKEPDGRYLIFCNMKVTADRVNDLLNANGFASASITGDLDQKKRMRVIEKFKSGDLPVLVATDVASRGLHIDGVTHVINYDLPQDADDYVHRIGRTARAGASGKAISLACEDYVFSLDEIEDYIDQKIPVVPIQDEMIVNDYRRVSGKRQEKDLRGRGQRGQRRGAGKGGSRRPGKPGEKTHTESRRETAPARAEAPSGQPVAKKKRRPRRKKKEGQGSRMQQVVKDS